MPNKVPYEVDKSIEELIRKYIITHDVPGLSEIKGALPKSCAALTEKLYEKVYQNDLGLLYSTAFIRCFDNTPEETLKVICDSLPNPKLSFRWFTSYRPAALYCQLRKGIAEGKIMDIKTFAQIYLDFSDDFDITSADNRHRYSREPE